ncbi:Hypothetical predicted protein [Pelobates cultripes]|uniref:Uncharacterized protein n=1 Tax=Pelobates cultripes TaxID=61616 RepID=A0AAD1RA67_PELCU|nr:Hypothetical predicted protein [Pelobates cultripes]
MAASDSICGAGRKKKAHELDKAAPAAPEDRGEQLILPTALQNHEANTELKAFFFFMTAQYAGRVNVHSVLILPYMVRTAIEG